MITVNIHEAKTQLSRLVEQAAQGEAFIIAKAGKPMVKVIPLGRTETGTACRLGFMAGGKTVAGGFVFMGGEGRGGAVFGCAAWVNVEIGTPEIAFDADFPQAGGTEHELIIRCQQQAARLGRKPFRRAGRPQQQVGIEQQIQAAFPANMPAISSLPI